MDAFHCAQEADILLKVSRYSNFRSVQLRSRFVGSCCALSPISTAEASQQVPEADRIISQVLERDLAGADPVHMNDNGGRIWAWGVAAAMSIGTSASSGSALSRFIVAGRARKGVRNMAEQISRCYAVRKPISSTGSPFPPAARTAYPRGGAFS